MERDILTENGRKDPSQLLYDLEIIKQISKGHFGVLYKAKTKTGDTVALKVCKRGDEHTEENSKKELFIYSHLPPHPNILQCYGYATTKDAVFILFEYLRNKDLWEMYFKDRQTQISTRRVAKYVWQLCDALRFLHYFLN